MEEEWLEPEEKVYVSREQWLEGKKRVVKKLVNEGAEIAPLAQAVLDAYTAIAALVERMEEAKKDGYLGWWAEAIEDQIKDEKCERDGLGAILDGLSLDYPR